MSGSSSSLDQALRQFEAAEANLTKLERLWREIETLTPSGIQFGADREYEDRCRSYKGLIGALPMIDGWKATALPEDLEDIAQSRLDAHELGEISAHVSVERMVEAPGVELAEYRFRLNNKRRALIRDALIGLMQQFDETLGSIQRSCDPEPECWVSMESAEWDVLRDLVKQIEVLLGSSVDQPTRWSMLRRHLGFAMYNDFKDIERMDWPQAKAAITAGLYGTNEPIPVETQDLGSLVGQRPSGSIATELRWSAMSAQTFERLIFELIRTEGGYENPQWLTHTTAADRGRDLSAKRVFRDPLTGSFEQRVIIQCRHRASSVSGSDVALLKEQMKLWEPPRVDVLIIASTGRFTADAIAMIERHNQSDSGLKIEMWPDSHLEHLLAGRPSLIAEFGLR